MYHKVAVRPVETVWPGTYVHPETFRRHLNYLSRRYALITTAEYVTDRRITGRAVLTFDDATADFGETVLPLISQFDAKATVYIPSARIGQTNSWDAADVQVPLMTVDSLKKAAGEGIELGAHTRTHADLTRLSGEELKDEVIGSRVELETIFGHRPATFCYPYGRFNEEVVTAVRGAGFEAAVSTRKGSDPAEGDPFLIRRIAIRHDTSLPILIYKLWRARRFGR